MKRKLHMLSNIIFYIAIAISIYALGKTYFERSKLPDGVCPVNNNRSILTIAIAVIIIYLIITFIEWYINKKK
ncbi:hypothetical protein SH1V18_35940 [Vallitalea longa]|uniref:Uncharacterized protein n=1 Tax=Vallitalea longa TaxID=2936439 RepID=A0A9W6DHR2_9FIRM|nr:hypothetical protein [Vallitalea longa]GKX31114.1 hypothetical protein SH1V18_35940 [Vallitalea longa]